MSTTNKTTTGAWLTIALIIVIIFACIAVGGVVWKALTGVQNDDTAVSTPHKPSATPTPKPTRANEPTGTPAPDYEAKKAALRQSVAELEVKIKEMEAEQKAIQDEDDRKVQIQLNDAEINRAWLQVLIMANQLLNDIDAANFARDIEKIALNEAAIKAQDEIDFAAKRLQRDNEIRIFWQLIPFGIILVVVGVVLAGFISKYREINKREQPVPRVILEIKDNDGHRTRFEDLPVTVEQFKAWAQAVVNGESISYKDWVDTGRMSRTDYDSLTAIMHTAGIIEYKNGQANQGQRGTRAGIASLNNWLSSVQHAA